MSQERINELRREIEGHRKKYYVDDAPVISDPEYDKLERELQTLEKEFPQFASATSPTQTVGYAPSNQFGTMKHRAPMLSLDNAFSEDERSAFLTRTETQSEVDTSGLYVDLKFDGLALNLLYQNGHLIRVLTRGDGTTGEDITPVGMEIQNIPHTLKDKPKGFVEIRGEAVMYREEFNRINALLIKAGKKPYVTLRNTVSGTLRQLDPSVVADRRIQFMPYGVGSLSFRFATGSTHSQVMQWIEDQGFKVYPYTMITKDKDKVLRWFEDTEKNRLSFPFDIDGIVVKVNNLLYQEQTGYTNRVPRWALAFKFFDHPEKSTLLSVDFQVGRTGVITPVANIKPVVVGGVTVDRATLHNESELRNWNLRLGDTVSVVRSGEVIPKIVGVEHTEASGELICFPIACPSCGSPLSKDPDGVKIYCRAGIRCKGQLTASIVHLASKAAMNIDGLGESMAETLVENGIVHNLSEIFNLTTDKLIRLHRVGGEIARKLVNRIQDARSTTLNRFLVALNIPDLGEDTANQLVKHFVSFDKIRRATLDELKVIRGIGPKTAASVYNWFHDKANDAMVDILLLDASRGGSGIHWAEFDLSTQAKLPLNGLRVALTGSLTEPRENVKAVLRSLGADIAAGVSKNVDILIAGSDAGSKLDTATDLGIEIWSEDQYHSMVKRYAA